MAEHSVRNFKIDVGPCLRHISGQAACSRTFRQVRVCRCFEEHLRAQSLRLCTVSRRCVIIPLVGTLPGALRCRASLL